MAGILVQSPESIPSARLIQEDMMSNWLAVNEHPIERGARVILGGALVAMAAMGTIGAWGYIGVVPILTGAPTTKDAVWALQ